MSRVNRGRRGIGTTEKLLFLLVGGGIGATVALILAPKPGIELREDIAGATRKGLERGRSVAVQIGETATDYYGTAIEKAGDLYGVAGERAVDLVGQVRQSVTAPGNTLSAAIEAGKQAYWEEKRRSESSRIREGRASYPLELGEEPKRGRK